MSGLAGTVILFAVASLVGPLIYWVTWPPNSWQPAIGGFIVNLVLLLWPAQPFGVVEHISGTAVAILLTIGINVIFFCFIGLFVWLAKSSPFLVIGIFTVLVAFIFLVALWASGFVIFEFDVWAFAVAIGFYAAIFRFSVRHTATE